MELVIASHNAGKFREIKQILTPLKWNISSAAELKIDDIEETGLTYVENAILKARHVAKVTGKPALSDDSGLCVDALNGAPGIYSARYAGEGANAEDRNNKLLRELADTPDEKRTAYFYCAMVLMQHEHDPTPLICEGKCSGTILHTPQGTHGFGYDPLLFLKEQACGFAELPPERRNQISHRGKALKKLLKQLEALL